MTQPALFSDYEPVEPESTKPLSADRRRTLRQRQQIEGGIHPLTGFRTRPELGTCGDCRHRMVLQYHNSSYPKCTLREERMTHGASTDCRAWWPACHEHELGDPKVSADAMRVRP